jgi:hypothetical protein
MLAKLLSYSEADTAAPDVVINRLWLRPYLVLEFKVELYALFEFLDMYLPTAFASSELVIAVEFLVSGTDKLYD